MSLEVKNVTAGYYEDIDILHEVSIRAEKSRITSIVGPNGAGKSTLLKTIFGFLKPKKGKILYNDEDITGFAPHLLLEKGIAYVPQHRSTFPHMTVEENLMLGGWIIRNNRKLIKERLWEMYNMFPNLKEKRKIGAGFLSGGELRMLDIAKALFVNPEVILVDEPTAGLAPKYFDSVYNRLEALSKKEGKTVLLVDQNIKLAIELADYVYVLQMGKNQVEGSKEEFKTGRIRDIIREWFTV